MKDDGSLSFKNARDAVQPPVCNRRKRQHPLPKMPAAPRQLAPLDSEGDGIAQSVSVQQGKRRRLIKPIREHLQRVSVEQSLILGRQVADIGASCTMASSSSSVASRIDALRLRVQAREKAG